MNKTKIPYLDFCWNPCGFGCSGGCPTCWARRQATSKGPTAPTCPKCRDFRVHFHEERMERKLSPAGRKKPAVVGVQFLGDLFDQKRPVDEAISVLDVLIEQCPQHTDVLLTQQYARSRDILGTFYGRAIGRRKAVGGGGLDVHHWAERALHVGTTCTTQADYDAAAKMYAGTGWKWWVSAEPLKNAIGPSKWNYPSTVVIGADNRQNADCGVAVIRQTARAFADAGVKVYVKQMWLRQCPNCGNRYEDRDLGPASRCSCGTAAEDIGSYLETDPRNFPPDLRMRQLPWTLTMKQEAMNAQ